MCNMCCNQSGKQVAHKELLSGSLCWWIYYCGFVWCHLMGLFWEIVDRCFLGTKLFVVIVIQNSLIMNSSRFLRILRFMVKLATDKFEFEGDMETPFAREFMVWKEPYLWNGFISCILCIWTRYDLCHLWIKQTLKHDFFYQMTSRVDKSQSNQSVLRHFPLRKVVAINIWCYKQTFDQICCNL